MINVRIPATTTNFGPGFDCLGMALDIYNEIDVEVSNELCIIVPDVDKGIIPTDESNLIYCAMKRAYGRVNRQMPGVKIVQRNGIPLARGMGSSAACIVGGILAANALMDGAMSYEDMLSLATEMDGHPDNVLPAFVGGLCAAAMEGERVKYVKMTPHGDFSFALLIPDFELPTKKARGVLPQSYSRTDAVAAVGRAVLMTTSLVNGQAGNINLAATDTLHQPYRKDLIAHYDEVVELAYSEGAHGVYLSGAGPTIAAIISGERQSFVDRIKKHLPAAWQIKATCCDLEGAIVTPV